jgi:hypothetical protein
MKKTLAIIGACLAGGYTGFCVNLIALSVDAAWKGVLQSGYEGNLGVVIGIFLAFIAGALGGVAGTGRFGAYLGALGFGALFVWLCWCVLYELSRMDLQTTVVCLILLTDVALAGAVGLAIAKRMTSRPRRQFSLNTLLALVMMCAVPCGLVGVTGQQVKKCREQKVAASRKEQWQVLAKLQHFQCFPEWGTVEYEGHVLGLRLVAIPSLQDNDLRDDLAHLKGLVRLRGIQSLDLHGTQVSDQGLAHLSELDKVEELNLGETQVTDAGLKHLKGLTKLYYLNLMGTQVTNEGVKKLKQSLSNCEVVH